MNQRERKLEKLIEFRDLFRTLKNSVSSIEELSVKLGSGFSRSTIQRYFHELYDKGLIGEEEYKDIQQWLKKSKESGLSKGGTNSQRSHGYSKDDQGHFMGSKK